MKCLKHRNETFWVVIGVENRLMGLEKTRKTRERIKPASCEWCPARFHVSIARDAKMAPRRSCLLKCQSIKWGSTLMLWLTQGTCKARLIAGIPMAFQRTEKLKQCYILALLLFGWRSHHGTDGDLTVSIASSKHFLKTLDSHIIERCGKVSRLGYISGIWVLPGIRLGISSLMFWNAARSMSNSNIFVFL